MTPEIYNIAAQLKGDFWDGLKFSLKDTNSNLPLVLTNTTIKIQFRKAGKTGTLVKELTELNGLTVDNINGTIQINGFKLDWDVETYYWDIQITFPNDMPKTYIEGIMVITQDTTN